MSNTDLSEYIPKFVLSNYDMNVDVRIKNAPNKTFIYTWIIFTPKKITSLTPNETNFFAKYDWIHRPNEKEELVYDDATYIRKNDMPIIRYISGTYYLDEFCDKMAKDLTLQTIEKIKSGEELPKISLGDLVYFNYGKNKF
jgi:hypothetical protein